jgi:catechol 2,3-dioxygenase-like lactoylglutathione lyase family enzyme
VLESLDYPYVPAPDIEASVRYYTDVMGGRLAWKIHAYDVWVACVQIAKKEPPFVLLADHIKDMMLIYRVASLDSAASELRSRGWQETERIEIPPGPCCTFSDPAGNRLVIHENSRPSVMDEFAGRVDPAT